MTGTPDLNIAGSPIYENLVATTGDPYQPPAYQPPNMYGAPAAVEPAVTGYDGTRGWNAGPGWPQAAVGTPAMLSQFLSRMLGDGQSWVAVLIFGGPMADQLRHHQQPLGPVPPQAPYGSPVQPGYGSVPGYSGSPGASGPGWGDSAAMAAAYQQYQQYYQWAAQQQAMLAAAPPAPPALTAGPESSGAFASQPATPPALPPAEETQSYGGMLSQDWAGWLGQISQNTRPQEAEQEEPEERRGGRLTGRFGAAMRELRGK